MDETLLDPSVLSGLNSTYIADLYEKWLDDPSNVDSIWRGWFENLKSSGSFNSSLIYLTLLSYKLLSSVKALIWYFFRLL